MGIRVNIFLIFYSLSYLVSSREFRLVAGPNFRLLRRPPDFLLVHPRVIIVIRETEMSVEREGKEERRKPLLADGLEWWEEEGDANGS